MAKIIFQSQPRGIKSLGRGWRTPDPSPSRDLVEKLEPIMTIIEVDSKKHGHLEGELRDKSSTWDFTTTRTPSHSPDKQSDFLIQAQDEVMTPRGHGATHSAWETEGLLGQEMPVQWQQTVEKLVYPPETFEQRQTIPPSQLLLFDMLQESCNEPQCTIPASIRFCESFIAAASIRAELVKQCSAQQGRSALATLGSDTHCPKKSEHKLKAETTIKNPMPPVSRGSVGHPYSCAEACKYAKKKRGCKDGSSCDHCHLCDWKRYESGRAACRAVARSKWENQ
jgi:hypothetical protein